MPWLMNKMIDGEPAEPIRQAVKFAETERLERVCLRWAKVVANEDIAVTAELEFADGLALGRSELRYPRVTLGRIAVEFGEAKAALDIWLATGYLFDLELPVPQTTVTRSRDRGSRSGRSWPIWSTFAPIGGSASMGVTSEPLVARGLPAWRTINEALDWWFVAPGELTRQHGYPGQLRVIVQDPRARIAQVDWDPPWQPERMCVTCEGRPGLEAAELQVRFVDHIGYGTTEHLPAYPPQAIALPPGTESVAIYLLLADGTLADTLVPQRIGSDLADGPPPSLEHQIAEDLRLGEGDRVEFKTFITPKDPKEAELVDTVVAFSNSGGGRLYLGVEDNGTLSGHGGFRRFSADDRDRTLERLEAWFKKLVAENVKPTPVLEVHSLEYQGNPLLVAVVGAGDSTPYSSRNNDIRIRSGATNRRPDPQTELPALMPKPVVNSKLTGFY